MEDRPDWRIALQADHIKRLEGKIKDLEKQLDNYFIVSQKYSRLKKLIKELRLVGQESMRAGRMIAGAWLMCKIDEVEDADKT